MRKVNLVLILMLIAAARTARADIIYVSGDQTGTWSADTVMVTGEVRVPPGETLVIEPGVKVLFQVYCKFIVDSAATLSAVGRMTMPIYFDDFIDGAKWHGIRFIHASAATRVEFCHFRHGYGSGSSSDAYGGAIYCYGSDITIRNCIIDSCSAQKGGAIAVEFSAGELSRNIIRKNTNWGGNNQGCGIYCNNANPVICQNLISENGYAPAQGGGLYCLNSSPIIAGNLFVENSSSSGGAMKLQDSECTLEHNAFIHNGVGGMTYESAYGGGLRCSNSNLTLSHCSFIDNSAVAFLTYSYGGAIYASSSDLIMDKCSFIDNFATAYAYGQGGIHLVNSTSEIRNSILWNNNPGQIYLGSGASVAVDFTCIQAGWTGTGNIDLIPQFSDSLEYDYRLLWGSPCIDSGDPDPIYNDPDGTRADMGAFYYDQSVMVRVLLTPHEIPYLIPDLGGTMDYTIRAFNRDSLAHTATIWCDVALPDSSIYGPVLGPVTVTIGAGAGLERVRTQNVPAAAPMGVYHYHAYAVVEADTSFDSFMFGKLGTPGAAAAGAWTNAGEEFASNVGAQHAAPWSGSGATPTIAISPNPFNPLTTIRFSLPQAGQVNLAVYDLQGRLVAQLVNGSRPAGVHEVTWDASQQASGMYFCRLQAGNFTSIKKMMLVK